MLAITFTANVAKVRVAPAIRGRVRARAGARVAIRASAGEEGTRVASFDAVFDHLQELSGRRAEQVIEERKGQLEAA